MAKKILVVDDDSLVVKSLGRLLETEGYAVAIARHGQEACDIIAKSDFELIISDIRMPDLDGVQTIQRIRGFLKDTKRPQPPVIFITGYPNDIKEEDIYKLNTVDFIYKPFEKDKFLESIASAIKE